MHTSSTRHGVVEYFRDNYGFIVVRNNNKDGSVQKFFLHVSNCLNDKPKVGSTVMFESGAIPPGRTLPIALKIVTLRDKLVIPASTADTSAGSAALTTATAETKSTETNSAEDSPVSVQNGGAGAL